MSAPTRPMSLALLCAALVVSACGLVYELVAGALASYLVGDTITQFSTVIGTYLFAMGVGAWLAQYIVRELAAMFVRVELMVGVLGGLSTLLLHAVFASGHGFLPALYGVVFLVGTLVGIEIPLLLRILKDTLRFETLVSRVLSFDYLGALGACLLFPLWFVPQLGLMKTSLFFGLVNVAVAALTLRLLVPPPRTALWLASAACAALLGSAWMHAERFAQQLDRRIYQEAVIYTEQTPYQRIVVTQDNGHTSLYLNSHLQFNSADEYRYHEALVQPLMRAHPDARRALVLGGGDGLAVRELLRWPQLESITLVDLDPAVTGLFTRNRMLAPLNGGAFADPRVHVVNTDAWQWLLDNHEQFAAIVVDFPDPTNFSVAKLYTQTFYHLLARALTPEGHAVIQSTSPLFAREAYWCVAQTLENAGFITTPYHVYVPSFGEWGYVLAGHVPYAATGPLPAGLRYLNDDTFAALFTFSADMARLPVQANRLDTQMLVRYYEDGWRRSLGRGDGY